jgi:DNA-binding MarR family transcriptional regulator
MYWKATKTSPADITATDHLLEERGHIERLRPEETRPVDLG